MDELILLETFHACSMQSTCRFRHSPSLSPQFCQQFDAVESSALLLFFFSSFQYTSSTATPKVLFWFFIASPHDLSMATIISFLHAAILEFHISLLLIDILAAEISPLSPLSSSVIKPKYGMDQCALYFCLSNVCLQVTCFTRRSSKPHCH